ncbi:MAG TPA: hypothetical protein VK945_13330, partial [Planococcus sp. (in: firmicutes)]|nr:hypothetical protein [Planococcus sp. (in: firmicutes)]
MTMKLEQFWSLQGPFIDKNGDGVIDGVSLFIHFPGNKMPSGMLDFCARLGLETTALSFDWFEWSGQKTTMEFIESAGSTYAEFEGDRLRCFYENEAALSELLSELAQMGRSHYAPPAESPTRHIRSLAELWSFSGFGAMDEATPHHALSLNIDMDEAVASPDLFRELCFFAARCGLYSTALDLPLTGNPNARIALAVVSGDASRLRLPADNRLELSGSPQGTARALQGLNRSHHWSSGGEFGYWEEETQLADKEEAEGWFETEWHGRSERKRMHDILEGLSLTGGDRLEIFLSEPLSIRRKLEP